MSFGGLSSSSIHCAREFSSVNHHGAQTRPASRDLVLPDLQVDAAVLRRILPSMESSKLRSLDIRLTLARDAEDEESAQPYLSALLEKLPTSLEHLGLNWTILADDRMPNRSTEDEAKILSRKLSQLVNLRVLRMGGHYPNCRAFSWRRLARLPRLEQVVFLQSDKVAYLRADGTETEQNRNGLTFEYDSAQRELCQWLADSRAFPSLRKIELQAMSDDVRNPDANLALQCFRRGIAFTVDVIEPRPNVRESRAAFMSSRGLRDIMDEDD